MDLQRVQCPLCRGDGAPNDFDPWSDCCRWCGGIGTVTAQEVAEFEQWLADSAPPPLSAQEVEEIFKECGF